jgi:VanZ family protein
MVLSVLLCPDRSLGMPQLPGSPMEFFMALIPKILIRLPALLVVAAIWILSSQSTLPVPKGILGFDKLQHLLAYLALAGTLTFWFSPKQREFHRNRTLLLITFIASIYGVSDELHQFFVPGRDCNVWDWVADTLGAFIGVSAALLADRYLLKHRL